MFLLNVQVLFVCIVCRFLFLGSKAVAPVPEQAQGRGSWSLSEPPLRGSRLLSQYLSFVVKQLNSYSDLREVPRSFLLACYLLAVHWRYFLCAVCYVTDAQYKACQ